MFQNTGHLPALPRYRTSTAEFGDRYPWNALLLRSQHRQRQSHSEPNSQISRKNKRVYNYLLRPEGILRDRIAKRSSSREETQRDWLLCLGPGNDSSMGVPLDVPPSFGFRDVRQSPRSLVIVGRSIRENVLANTTSCAFKCL
uniref:Uncharacterized protein n=1 Tax=Steinernema glaseri TaxID=37863 RepID=A0A1I8AKK7_9BILA